MLKRITCIALILAVALVFCNMALANDTNLPELKLSIKQLPPTAIPVMKYTAQLSFMPPNVYNALVVDYYNITDLTNTKLEYLGSAPFDNTLTSVFFKRIMPGTYVGIARTVINGIVIWSNKVEYKAY